MAFMENPMHNRCSILTSGCVFFWMASFAPAQNSAPLPLTVSGPVRAAQHVPGGVPYRILETDPNRTKSLGARAKSSLILPPRVFYPADMANPDNGPTVAAAKFHPIYVNN